MKLVVKDALGRPHCLAGRRRSGWLLCVRRMGRLRGRGLPIPRSGDRPPDHAADGSEHDDAAAQCRGELAKRVTGPVGIHGGTFSVRWSGLDGG